MNAGGSDVRELPNNEGIEPILWDDWHPVAELASLQHTGRHDTMLLGVPISIRLEAPGGRITAHSDGFSLPHVDTRYGFVWLCLGTPAQDIVDFEAAREGDRVNATGGSVGVAVSGLRAVENFLDLGHLPFVHQGYLGEEPHTEVKSYSVAPRPGGGIIATGCRVYQPKPSPVDSAGYDVDYIYEVWRPYIVMLYKANPVERSRMDLIALLVQPVTQERCVAHSLLSYPPYSVDAKSLRAFQQLIFAQDRPILENQLPKRLPLDPRAETSVRADTSSAHYRRWLADSGVRYGAIAQTST
jgi:phenylpropionate dioxygenase-like ring-hydroxylating dioxygenase large terminal subunit